MESTTVELEISLHASTVARLRPASDHLRRHSSDFESHSMPSTSIDEHVINARNKRFTTAALTRVISMFFLSLPLCLEVAINID